MERECRPDERAICVDFAILSSEKSRYSISSPTYKTTHCGLPFFCIVPKYNYVQETYDYLKDRYQKLFSYFAMTKEGFLKEAQSVYDAYRKKNEHVTISYANQRNNTYNDSWNSLEEKKETFSFDSIDNSESDREEKNIALPPPSLPPTTNNTVLPPPPSPFLATTTTLPPPPLPSPQEDLSTEVPVISQSTDPNEGKLLGGAASFDTQERNSQPDTLPMVHNTPSSSDEDMDAKDQPSSPIGAKRPLSDTNDSNEDQAECSSPSSYSLLFPFHSFRTSMDINIDGISRRLFP